jgi:hypothetical protein
MFGTCKRDALGMAFLVLHVAILVYIVIGWALPFVGYYIVVLPLVALHWPLNRNACVINNLESLIRTGRWRDPRNCEEGAWLKHLIKAAVGLELTARQVDRLSYGLVVVLWGLGIWHWFGWPTP